MTLPDPRTPVIVGAGQINDRDRGSEPIDLMTRCTEAALTDSGAAEAVRQRLDAVRVVWGVWPYRDPGTLVAERIGTPSVRTTNTTPGGNQVYDLVNDTAARIQSGEFDAVVICGAETLRTRRGDHARGVDTEYLPEVEGAAPDELLGRDDPFVTEREAEVGLTTVARFYAMAETALRHRLGEDIDSHRRRIAALWAGASEVASHNPNAWSRDALSAEDIAETSPSNRPVSSPYPKLMTSNLNVDQGGAVVMCSVEAATAAGVPSDRWIFPWSGTGAPDPWYMTNRWAFDESPGMRLSGRRTLDLAGLRHDDCAVIDLYSCFPVAVQLAQRELGIDTSRDFTITGGLTFAAGPLNCYCLLPLTRSIELLRNAPNDRAFLTGNGGTFTKHSALVLSGEPSGSGFRTDDLSEEAGRFPTRPTPEAPVGDATVETYTVTYDREMQPDRAVVACLDASGGRHWAESSDADTLQQLLTTDCCETPVTIDAGTARLG